MSKEAVARFLSGHPSRIEDALSVLAGTFFHLDRHYQSQLEDAVLQSDCTKVMYLELIRYDETPMRLTEKDAVVQLPSGPSSSSSAHMPQTTGPASGLTGRRGARGTAMGRSTTVAKLFATEVRYAMLIKLPRTAEQQELEPHFTIITGTALSHLQLLGQATGTVMRPCETTSTSPPVLSSSCARCASPQLTKLERMLLRSAR